MKKRISSFWLIAGWLVVLVTSAAIAQETVVTRGTRLAALVLPLSLWLGLIKVGWHRPVLRTGLITLPVALLGMLFLPISTCSDTSLLRADYVMALRRYEGVAYVWGGEGLHGMDCSGLVRRALQDACVHRGVRDFDPAMLRMAFAFWWRDRAAVDLGNATDGVTARLFEAAGINQLDHARLLPGDLAVTSDGLHVMAYLGEKTWIEADPGVRRVLVLTVPVKNNRWFDTPVRLMRWSVLRH